MLGLQVFLASGLVAWAGQIPLGSGFTFNYFVRRTYPDHRKPKACHNHDMLYSVAVTACPQTKTVPILGHMRGIYAGMSW